jgi:hypothetical protein
MSDLTQSRWLHIVPRTGSNISRKLVLARGKKMHAPMMLEKDFYPAFAF